MAPHAVDRILLLVALVGCLFIGILALIPIVYPQDKAPADSAADAMAAMKPKPTQYDVSCWQPSQFTSAQIGYVQTLCTDQFNSVMANKTAQAKADAAAAIASNPAAMEAQQTMMLEMKKSMMEKMQEKMSEVKDKMMTQYAIFVFVAVELAVACVVYVLAHAITSQAEFRGRFVQSSQSENAEEGKADEQESLMKKGDVRDLSRLAHTKGMSVSYFLLHTLAALVFIVLAFMCNSCCKMEEPDLEAIMAAMTGGDKQAAEGGVMSYGAQPSAPTSGDYTCNFNINNLGTIQKFSVQCRYTAQKSSTTPGGAALPDMSVSPVVGLTMMAVKFNLVLCILYAVIALIHVINVFAITPCSHREQMSAALRQHGVKAPQGVSYSFSNLSFVALLSDLGIKHSGVSSDEDSGHGSTAETHKESTIEEDKDSIKKEKEEAVEMEEKEPEEKEEKDEKEIA